MKKLVTNLLYCVKLAILLPPIIIGYVLVWIVMATYQYIMYKVKGEI